MIVIYNFTYVYFQGGQIALWYPFHSSVSVCLENAFNIVLQQSLQIIMIFKTSDLKIWSNVIVPLLFFSFKRNFAFWCVSAWNVSSVDIWNLLILTSQVPMGSLMFCFSAILMEKINPLNVIALCIFSARTALCYISFRNFLMPQEQHFEQLMVEHYIVSSQVRSWISLYWAWWGSWSFNAENR